MLSTSNRRTAFVICLPALLFSLGWVFMQIGLGVKIVAISHLLAKNSAYYQGRREIYHPSPRCCYAADCKHRDRGRYTVLTTLRSDNYLPLLEEMACSLRRSNPHLSLTVMTVEGDLAPSTLEAAHRLGRVVEVEDIRFPNYKNTGRYTLNWVKIRAWELTEYDGIIMVDSDTTILGDLSPLVDLPTDFAAVPDNARGFGVLYNSMGAIQAGVIFLRPCPAVARHMHQLAHSDVLLQFPYGNAEQDFFDWYFKYTAYTIPLEYNAVADRLQNNKTEGGVAPVIVHHTMYKPFKKISGAPGHQFLCRRWD